MSIRQIVVPIIFQVEDDDPRQKDIDLPRIIERRAISQALKLIGFCNGSDGPKRGISMNVNDVKVLVTYEGPDVKLTNVDNRQDP